MKNQAFSLPLHFTTNRVAMVGIRDIEPATDQPQKKKALLFSVVFCRYFQSTLWFSWMIYFNRAK